ncbi:MAG: orotate phosphoribosyltransferase [Gammaproteobacteria bacterium]|jgi:orotate phosphoribosyltransferase|nr:orotate phosphoribosyltransferase [Gammaproteobacteria bacterium]
MNPSLQQEFIACALQCQALRWGEFTLKSGRISPYFFNAGHFNTGKSLAQLGSFYAETIESSNLAFDMLVGPAYKGIPLVCATATILAERYQRNVPYAFNRKEVKDHGEKSVWVGAPVAGRVLILDDVITAGTAIRETIALIKAAGAEPCGVVVMLDRQEKGLGELSAIQEVENTYNIPVLSIATLKDLLAYTAADKDLGSVLAAIEAYNLLYGIK